MNGRWVEREVSVFLKSFFTFALIESAVEKNSGSVEIHKMHGSGSCSGGSVKSNFHEISFRLDKVPVCVSLRPRGGKDRGKGRMFA